MSAVLKADRRGWSPQLGPQAEAIRTAYFCEELFYGGARGGGKTDFLLGDFLADVGLGASWRGVLFRRSYPELDEIVRRSLEIYGPLGAEYKVGTHTWHFPGGATLKLRHIETAADAQKYQGHSYTWVGFDELTNWPDAAAYHRLKATLRAAERIEGKRIRATGNPGGPGHGWVKEYFVDPAPSGFQRIEGEFGQGRMFIPSRVSDNRILLQHDPAYMDRLRAVGDEQLVKAWLEGDWDALVGQFFAGWNSQEIVVDTFEIPMGWRLFAGMDYGENNPTSFGLYAVDYDDVVYRVTEYHQGDRSASEHAREVKSAIKGCPFTAGRMPTQIFADPSMWVKRRLDEQNSKSPADVFQAEGLHLTPANNDRVNGWRVCREALTRKAFKVFRGWNDAFLRTVPALPRDTRNPEDVDTSADDHAADGWRYCMVHTYKPRKLEAKPYRGTGQEVIDQLKALTAKQGRYK